MLSALLTLARFLRGFTLYFQKERYLFLIFICSFSYLKTSTRAPKAINF